jgi:hypothetical protein
MTESTPEYCFYLSFRSRKNTTSNAQAMDQLEALNHTDYHRSDCSDTWHRAYAKCSTLQCLYHEKLYDKIKSKTSRRRNPHPLCPSMSIVMDYISQRYPQKVPKPPSPSTPRSAPLDVNLSSIAENHTSSVTPTKVL